jgi:hypothetical protein
MSEKENNQRIERQNFDGHSDGERFVVGRY